MGDYYGNNDWRDYLALQHHGILGMKWGKKNGPPYPLGPSDHSASEKKAGWKKSLGILGRSEQKSKKASRQKDASAMANRKKKSTDVKEKRGPSEKATAQMNNYKKMGDEYDGDDYIEEMKFNDRKREARNKVIDAIADDLEKNGARSLTKDEEDIWDQVAMDYFYNTRHGDETWPGDHERNKRMTRVERSIISNRK